MPYDRDTERIPFCPNRGTAATETEGHSHHRKKRKKGDKLDEVNSYLEKQCCG